MDSADSLAKLMGSLSIKGGIKKKPCTKKKPTLLRMIGQTICKSDLPLAVLLKMRKYNIQVKYRD